MIAENIHLFAGHIIVNLTINDRHCRGFAGATAYTSLAVASAVIGNKGDAIKAVEQARMGLDSPPSQHYNLGTKRSVSLFLQLRRQEVEKDCKWVMKYVHKILPTLSRNRKN